MKILVIIVNYEGDENLKECLKSLDSGFRRNDKDSFDVRVHDNSGCNLGFAAGVNASLRETDPAMAGSLQKIYDWVWLLNPDCIVSVKGKLKEFMGIYGSDKGIVDVGYDIFSPVVYDEHGEIWFAGGKIDRIAGECKHIRGDRGDKGNRSIETSRETEWVSGCSMFIKPRVFEKIGFFDERFFLFYEDVDFCLRAKAAGFRIGVIGKEGIEGLDGLDDFKVIHKVSQSVKKLPNKYEIEMKSKFYLLKKHWRYFFPTAYLISKLRYLKHKLNYH